MSVVIMSVYQPIENLEELDVVLIVLKDALLVDSTQHDMIDASTQYHSLSFPVAACIDALLIDSANIVTFS